MDIGIYARISRDETGDAKGVERQVEDCEAKALALGWRVVDRYIDNDLSASKAVQRPQYDRLMADLANGAVRGVVVYDLDRLTRKPAELETFIVLADKKHIALANVSGDVDLGTANGRMLARIKGAVARQEADRIGERVKRQKAQRAARGEHQGGRYRLFGYTRDMVLIEEEAEIVREVFARRATGESTRSIALDLASRDIETTAGKPFKASSLDHLLKKPSYSGQREYHGEIVGKTAFEPIIDIDTFAATSKAMEIRAVRAGHNTRRHLLSGYLRCGMPGCRAKMSGNHRSINGRAKRTRYTCGSPDHSLSTYAEWVEKLVIGHVLNEHSKRLASPSDNVADHALALAAVDDEIADIWSRYRSGKLPTARFEGMLDAKESQRKELLKVTPVDARFDHLLAHKQWAELSLGERRGVVGQYVQSVTLRPGVGEDPRRLRIIGTDGSETTPTSSVGFAAKDAPLSHEHLVRMVLPSRSEDTQGRADTDGSGTEIPAK